MKTLFAGLTAASAIAFGASAAMAEDGETVVELTVLYAMYPNASPAPRYDWLCEDLFGEYLGGEIATRWRINTSTLIMYAQSEYLGSTVGLHPLGIHGTYAFMSDGVPQPLADRDIHQITFNLNTQFEDPESDVMFVFGGPVNCILSNKASM